MTFDVRWLGMKLAIIASLAIVSAGRAEAAAPTGACCAPNGACQSVVQITCEEQGGTYVGNGVLCENVECDARVAAPVLSMLGIVATVGALGGLGVLRLFRRRRVAS